jgi:hypothetical protein
MLYTRRIYVRHHLFLFELASSATSIAPASLSLPQSKLRPPSNACPQCPERRMRNLLAGTKRQRAQTSPYIKGRGSFPRLSITFRSQAAISSSTSKQIVMLHVRENNQKISRLAVASRLTAQRSHGGACRRKAW